MPFTLPSIYKRKASKTSYESAIGCITMSPDEELTKVTRGFICSADGESTITLADGTSATFTLVKSVVYPFAILSYASSGHTAGTIIALY